MTFSQTFKAIWWFILLCVLSTHIYFQYDRYSNENVSWFDGLVFLAWLGLSLGPLFREVNIFGFQLRNEIREMKEQLNGAIASVRSDMRLIAENTQTTNVYGAMPPPPDSRLDEIEASIKEVLESINQGKQEPLIADDVEKFIKDPNSPRVDVLFKARLTLEKEVRTIFELSSADIQIMARRSPPISRVLSILVDIGVLEPRLANAVREVYSVCSPAMHGEDVTEEQFEFVQHTAPELISTLRSVHKQLNWEYCT